MEIKLASDLGEITRNKLGLNADARVIYKPGERECDVLIWVLQAEREYPLWHHDKLSDFTTAENDSDIFLYGHLAEREKPLRGLLRKVLDATDPELLAMESSPQYGEPSRLLIRSEILCRKRCGHDMDPPAGTRTIELTGQRFSKFARHTRKT